MLANKIKKLHPHLMLASLIFLSSCAQANYNMCPTYPIAGPKVADAIQYIDSPSFWEWLARINKLRLQLEICNL